MILDEEFSDKFTKLLHDSGYRNNLESFVNLLRWTRMPFLKRNGLFMAVMQTNMLRYLVAFQKELRRLEKESKATTDVKEKSEVERKILIEKQWIRTLYTIADGIAWRAYGFNRPLLRVMSENSSPGDISQIDYDYVALLRRVLANAPRSTFRIANDLTRFLRIADFTVFYPDGRVILYEIKEKGKKIFDVGSILNEMKLHRVKPNPQKFRHLVAQMAVINNKIDVPIIQGNKITSRLEVEILDLDFPIHTHLKKLKGLIKKADKNVIATELVEDGYYIQVLALDRIKKGHDSESTKRQMDAAPEWIKERGGSTVKVGSWDAFLEAGTEFPRNILPYSVLPFSAKDCARIILGYVRISVFIKVESLKEKLIEEGWDVVVKDPTDGFAHNLKRSGEPMFSKNHEDVLFQLKRSDETGTYNTSVLLTQLLIMGSSFYSFRFITDGAMEMFKRAKLDRATRSISINYLGERKVLR